MQIADQGQFWNKELIKRSMPPPRDYASDIMKHVSFGGPQEDAHRKAFYQEII
jgi:hypothetical protein